MSIQSSVSRFGTLTPPIYPHNVAYYKTKNNDELDKLIFPLPLPPVVDFSQELSDVLQQTLLKAPLGTYYLEIQEILVKVFYVLKQISPFPTLCPQKKLGQMAFRRIALFNWEVIRPNQNSIPTTFSSWENCLKAEKQNLLQIPLHQYLRQRNQSQLINPAHFVPSTNAASQYLNDPQTVPGSYLFTQDVSNKNKNVFYLMFALALQQNQKTYQAKIEFTEKGYLILKDKQNVAVEIFTSFERLLAYSKQKFHLTVPLNSPPLPTFKVGDFMTNI